MSVFLSAMAPVILIIMIGYLANQKLNLDSKTLSSLTISVLTPALIVYGLAYSDLSLATAINLIISFLIISLFLYGLVLFFGKTFNLSSALKKTLVATTLFSNTGNLGLPFLAFSLGQEALERGILYMIVASAVMAICGPALLNADGLEVGFKLTLKMPLFWATLGGIFLKINHLKLPFNLDEGLRLLGEASIPTALLLLGMQLTKTQQKWGKSEFLASGLRLIIAPLVAILVANWLQIQGVDFQVLVLQGAMPVAVSSYVWVCEFGGDPPFTARVTIVSTLLSFFTLPLLLILIR